MASNGDQVNGSSESVVFSADGSRFAYVGRKRDEFTLIVDGEIYVNSSNGNDPSDPNSPVKLKDWHVGGDGFDIFGTGGRIEADYINTVGGW